MATAIESRITTTRQIADEALLWALRKGASPPPVAITAVTGPLSSAEVIAPTAPIFGVLTNTTAGTFALTMPSLGPSNAGNVITVEDGVSGGSWQTNAQEITVPAGYYVQTPGPVAGYASMAFVPGGNTFALPQAAGASYSWRFYATGGPGGAPLFKITCQ